MTEWILSGHVVDLILAVMVAEAIGLLVLWRWRGAGIAPVPLLANLAAGACVMMALRAALTGASPMTLALLLGLSFAAHLVDLAVRWQRKND
jgi:hypothetical protein